MRWLQLVKNSLSFGFWCMYMYYMYICTVNPKWETWKLWILVPNVIIFGWYNRIPYEGLSVVLYYLIKLQLVIIMINYNHHEAWWDIHELTGAPPCTFFPTEWGSASPIGKANRNIVPIWPKPYIYMIHVSAVCGRFCLTQPGVTCEAYSYGSRG